MSTSEKLQPPEAPRLQNGEQTQEYVLRLYRWLYEVYRHLDRAGILDWEIIDKTGGSISDIGTKDHNLLTSRDAESVHPHSSLSSVLQADDTSSDGSGSKHVTNALVKKYEDHRQASTNVHGIGSDSAVVGTNTTQQIENKTVSDLQIDLDGPNRTPTEGLLYWDTDAKTLVVKLSGPDVALQVGQEVLVRVLNKTGADIPNGSVVYVNGQHDNRPTIALAKADAAATAKFTGLTTETIEDNTTGYICRFGLLRDVDTSAFSAGDKVYLSATTAGAWTKTAPSFPNFIAFVGRVITSDATNGILGINPSVDFTNGVMVNTIGATAGKIGDIGNGHYSEFETDGTLKFNGNASVWDDLRVVPGAWSFAGTSDPEITDWQPGGSGATFKVYEFATSDQAFFTVQLPHAYKEGTNISVHVHWTPGARGNEENGKTVAWKMDYSWANIDGTFGASANADMTDTCDGTDHKHQMTPAVAITGTDKNISSMLVCRIYRDTGDTWASAVPGQQPVILEIDFHFEMDTVGSRAIGTK